MKIAIMTDSTSGITEEEARHLGVFVLPMPVTIDGQEYLEGVDLKREFFYQKQEEGAHITTSQPAPAAVEDLWHRLLEHYDRILYLPMSGGLSGSYATACALAEGWDGKVSVVNTRRISVPLWQMVEDARKMVEKGLPLEEIVGRLEDNAGNSSIYIVPITLEYLKRGGRITPSAAAIGTVLNIKPVLQIQGERIEPCAKVRGVRQAVEKLFAELDKDLESRFAGKTVRVFAAYSGDACVGTRWEKQMREHYGSAFVRIDPLALNITSHTGPGAIALGCAVIEEIKD